MTVDREQHYVDLLVQPIRVCAEYKPNLGHRRPGGMTLDAFQELYRSDPFYAWLGLDNPLMYAAHKAAGGMTSIYRQIGIGCEHLFRQILQDELGLSDEECEWSYTTRGKNKKIRTLSLDARIPLASVRDPARRAAVADWMREVAAEIHVSESIIRVLRGVVFEVRQGYKSKDSKRQNADIASAATAYSEAYLPCALILSRQFADDLFVPYRSERWVILTGQLAGASRRDSTYHFVREVIGFDLAGFFERNAAAFHDEVAKVLEALLRVE